MSLLTPTQKFFENLKGAIAVDSWGYTPPDEAYKWLKKLTGQDFGRDFDKWERWLFENATDFRYGSYGERVQKKLTGHSD